MSIGISEIEENVSEITEISTKLTNEECKLKDTLKQIENKLQEMKEDSFLVEKLKTIEEQLKISEKKNEQEERKLFLSTRPYVRKRGSDLKEARDVAAEVSKQLKREVNKKDKLLQTYERLQNNETILNEEIESKKNLIEELEKKKENLEIKLDQIQIILRNKSEIVVEQRSKNDILNTKVEEQKEELKEQNDKLQLATDKLNNTKCSLYSVTSTLKEERKLNEISVKTHDALEKSADRCKEEKRTQMENIENLQENIARKNNEFKTKDYDLLRWKEQIDKRTKSMVMLERELVKLEKSKEAIEKIQEKKKNTMASLQKDISNYKKKCGEYQNNIYWLNRQQMATDDEVQNAKSAKKRVSTLVKMNRQKEEALENRLKQIRAETRKFATSLISSEKIKNSFSNEYVILINEEKAVQNELKVLERKLSVCADTLKNKESKKNELKETLEKCENEKNKQMHLYENSQFTARRTEAKLRTLTNNKNISKRKLDIQKIKLKQRKLLLEKFKNDLKIQESELKKQFEIAENNNSNIKTYIHLINEVQREAKRINENIIEEKTILEKERRVFKKATAKLNLLENKLKNCKEETITQSKSLEYIKREKCKHQEGIRGLKCDLDQAVVKSNYFDEKKFDIHKLRTKIKDYNVNLIKDTLQYLSLKNHILDPLNTNKWRIIQSEIDDINELMRENKLILENHVCLKNQILDKTLKGEEKNSTIEKVKDKFSSDTESAEVFNQCRAVENLLKKLTGQIMV
ncbi:cilia- and flagella-associated protein 58-like [Centruroides vittatus]|uniref:cilia- and flagella-associated protein 58-like n=1 Tax=Centruroides vittatus TaxID=120091 RepID=UPI00350FDA2B